MLSEEWRQAPAYSTSSDPRDNFSDALCVQRRAIVFPFVQPLEPSRSGPGIWRDARVRTRQFSESFCLCSDQLGVFAQCKYIGCKSMSEIHSTRSKCNSRYCISWMSEIKPEVYLLLFQPVLTVASYLNFTPNLDGPHSLPAFAGMCIPGPRWCRTIYPLMAH
jgi:hypothetical protein